MRFGWIIAEQIDGTWCISSEDNDPTMSWASFATHAAARDALMRFIAGELKTYYYDEKGNELDG